MSKHRQVFEEFAEEAKDRLGESLKKMILYGSVAREEETNQSDVDVFVVVENLEQKKMVQRLGAKIGVENGVPMSPIVRTEREYEDMKETSFLQNVQKEGEAYV